MNLTDNETIKALEWCEQFEHNIVFKGNGDEKCVQALQMMVVIKHALKEYNRQKAENKDLFYKLTGVMHSVDKWLDGDELKGDEVRRACTMREKLLRITEQQKAEIEELRANYNYLFKTMPHMKTEAIKEFAERLKDKRDGGTYPYVLVNVIDNLVKEMVGD